MPSITDAATLHARKHANRGGRTLTERNGDSELEQVARDLIVPTFLEALQDRKSHTIARLRSENPNIGRLLKQIQPALKDRDIQALLQADPRIISQTDPSGKRWVALDPRRAVEPVAEASTSAPKPVARPRQSMPVAGSSKPTPPNRRASQIPTKQKGKEREKEKDDLFSGSDSDDAAEAEVVAAQLASQAKTKRHSLAHPPIASTSNDDTSRNKEIWSAVSVKDADRASSQKKRHSMPGAKSKLPTRAEMEARESATQQIARMIDLTLGSDGEQERVDQARRVEPEASSQTDTEQQANAAANKEQDELQEDEDFALPPALRTRKEPSGDLPNDDNVQQTIVEQSSGDQDIPMTDVQDGQNMGVDGTPAMNDGAPQTASSEEDEAEAHAERQRSRRRSVRSTRSSISSVRRSKGVPSERMEVDDSDAEEGEPNLTSSQLKRKAKDKSLPPPLLGPYQAARQGTVPPVGKKLAESRDSSANIDDSAAEEIEGAMTAQVQSQAAPAMRRTATDPTKPSSIRRTGPVLKSSRPRTLGPNGEILDDEDSDEDVVYVTSVAAGSAPSKPRKSMQEREAEKAEREARRIAKEKRKEKKKSRRAIPSFKKKLEEEAAELEEAYNAREEQLRAAFGLQPGEKLDDELLGMSWKIFESFEPTRKEIGKNGERSDLHTVKFWPYHLPFPGRRKNEAIVAVAGWCEVRVFLLSKERGVSELWNAIDESFSWEREEEVENFLAMAWTYEVRDKDTSISPYWQKWPLLCLAGVGREIKILDGYSGTTVKIIQGHGGSIMTLAVHPQLPHIIATGSMDESISLWDISVPVSKPDTIVAKFRDAHHEGKRWKGYADYERLAIFGGWGGHIEAVLSIAFHPCLPLLASGGVDCKLRIWRLPHTLPQHPTSSIMKPTPTAPPISSVRPPSFSQPIFTNTSLHSHHIDHVSWLGSSGHLVTRSMCWDSPGRRVVRVFRPDFFDTLEVQKIPSVIGAPVTVSSDVTLLARWTSAACSDNIADGIMCSANELSYDHDRKALSTQRKLYIPTTEPAIHIYNVDLNKPQEDVDNLRRQYPIKPGDEVLDERHPVRDAQLRAMDVHLGGSGWIVAVGEQEKLCVWIKKEPLDLDHLLRTHRNELAQAAPTPRREYDDIPAEARTDVSGDAEPSDGQAGRQNHNGALR